MRVLVTGASGFIGRVLVKELLNQGHDVVVLTSNIPRSALILGSRCSYFQWVDTKELPPLEAFEGVDGVINLMGENIGKRPWSEEQKKKIYDSRIDGTARLVEAMQKLDKRPRALVSASAIGFYGDRGSQEVNEESDPGSDFLATVCKDWEQEANKAQDLGLRVVIIRTGLVLGKNGGALAKMLPPFKFGLGGRLGPGTQYMSWIHVLDLALLYIEAVKNETMKGVYNGTAPYPATNLEFTKALGHTLRRPTVFPVPAFVLQKVLGEMSTLLLTGQRIVPYRCKEIRFRYRYPTLDLALKDSAH